MHVGDICVKATGDYPICHINGITVLPQNRLVVTDWTNNAVKLVKANLSKVISRVSLTSQPLDVMRIQPDQVAHLAFSPRPWDEISFTTKPELVAVSLGNEEKIEIYDVSDTLSRTKTIQIPGTTFSGICYENGRFIVVSEATHDVKIIDLTGNIVSTMSMDSHNDPLFKSPRYVTLRRLNYSVFDKYITDQAENTVTYVDSNSQINWVYGHARLKCPVGISVDKEGDILVCSRDTGVVHVLSPHTGLLSKEIQLGVPPNPQALCVFGDQMWISSASTSSEDGDFVRMFQLEYTA